MSLSRFHEARADPYAGYDTALAEIRRERTITHWVWGIFPQLVGLGRSVSAEKYAIRDLAEACDYLRDPLLELATRKSLLPSATNSRVGRLP